MIIYLKIFFGQCFNFVGLGYKTSHLEFAIRGSESLYTVQQNFCLNPFKLQNRPILKQNKFVSILNCIQLNSWSFKTVSADFCPCSKNHCNKNIFIVSTVSLVFASTLLAALFFMCFNSKVIYMNGRRK